MAWEPLANVGLHHRRAKASIQGGRENIHTEDKVTRMQKKSQNTDIKPKLIMTSASDIKADVRKNMRGHWLIEDEYDEFICENV